MPPLTFALVIGLVVTQFSAYVRASDALTDGTYIITPAAPVWLLEQPYADGPMLTARTFGGSAYGDHHVKASLEISCHPQSPTASLALQITPAALDFDVTPFEGPDASANGPLRITTATRTSIEHSVNGIWTYGGAFQIGTVFALNATVPHDELAYWASDASRGQTLKLSIAPAKEGDRNVLVACQQQRVEKSHSALPR